MFNIPVKRVTTIGDSVQLTISSLRATLTVRANDSVAVGYYQQGTAKLPVRLNRQVSAIAKPARPQEPSFPLSYPEEVAFPNEQERISLAGTLTRPLNTRKYPAVVLVPGSGANDRDEHIFGHKIFLVLADYLTRQGFAVLRTDDRGVGDSEGKFSTASIKDLADDVKAAVLYLKSRPDVDPKRITVLGHSLGAEIAGLAALNNPEVHAVVLLAGAAEPLRETIFKQTNNIYTQQGLSAKAVQTNHKVLKAVFDNVAEQADNEAAQRAIASAFKTVDADVAALTPAEREALELPTPLDARQFSQFWGKAMRFDLFYNPLQTLSALTIPVLALQGDKDVQVAPDNQTRIVRQLKHRHSTGRLFAGVNHLFQTCVKCTIPEYSQLTETMSPTVLTTIAEWLKRLD